MTDTAKLIAQAYGISGEDPRFGVLADALEAAEAENQRLRETLTGLLDACDRAVIGLEASGSFRQTLAASRAVLEGAA